MDPEGCEFIAQNEVVQILPNFREKEISLVCGNVGPFEPGTTCSVPIWLAIHLKKRHKCSIIAPDWLSTESIKRFIVAENEGPLLSPIPDHFFEVSHTLLINASSDIENIDQIKTLVKDLWDKREAKMRTSTLKFLKDASTYTKITNLTELEIAYSKPAITEASRVIEKLYNNLHSIK